MKHLKKIIFTLLLLVCIPITTHAASGTISVSSSSSAVVGNTITVTVKLSSSSALGSWDMDLSYNSSYLKLTSSSAENGGTYMVGYASNSSTYSKTYTFQFQVLKSGSTTVGVNSYLVYGFDESEMSISSSTKTIRLMTQAELEATYSSDNNLKALSINDYELTPAFSADTLEYTVTVPSEVTKVTINATKNDSTATVSGDGEHEVNEGSNVFEINVQAQNGSTKTYKITVNVEDANPISITANNSSYTVVKRKDNIEAPSSYTETTVTIDDVEVPAYYSEASGLTLIGVKDEEGNVYLAIYYADENRYEIYNENKSDQLILYIKEIPEEKEGFIKSTITINDETYECLKLNNSNSDFILIYAMNTLTGEEDYYIYDKENNSYVLYNGELMNMYVTETEKYKQVILYGGIGAVVVIFILLIICMRKPKHSKKKKITSEPKEEKEIKVEKIDIQKQKQDEEELEKEIEEKLNKKEPSKSSKNTSKNKSKTQKKETTPKTNTEVLNKVNEATKIIEDFEETTALKKEDLKEVKEQNKKTTEELEATMYDLFKEDKQKKRKKKKK